MSDFAQPEPVSIPQPEAKAIEAQSAAASTAEHTEALGLGRLLMNPWVDKILAIVAVTPFVYPIFIHFRTQLKIGELIYLGQILLLVGTMVFRRTAVRITTNAYSWLVAFLASYWGLFILSVEEPGGMLANPWVLRSLYAAAVFMDVWGRISLGRNIGMLPAQREIVVRGAYRWMRHPIYTAFFLMLIAGALGSFSTRNFYLYALGALWFVARTNAEEEFLQTDPAYAAYMRRVPWRWFPGLV